MRGIEWIKDHNVANRFEREALTYLCELRIKNNI